MSYRRTLLRRWSRQDWVAIGVIALAVGFLTGAGLIVDATATRTSDIASSQPNPANVSWYESPEDAHQATGQDALVFPVAQASVDGNPVTIIGVPPETIAFANRTDIPLPAQPPPDTVRQGSATDTVRLNGTNTTITAAVQPADRTVLSPQWYQARPEAVDTLGTTDALALNPTDGTTPVQGALAFFLTGARGAIQLVGLIATGAGLLLGVVVFGVTRVTVRDRWQTIRTIRATGGTARTINKLFAARAAIQTALGVGLGYAVGVILTNIVVAVAVFAGRPVALAPQFTLRLVTVLLPAYLALIGIGALSGALAARPFVTGPPIQPDTATPSSDSSSRFARLSRLQPTLLGWRAVLPTAITLAVFLTFVIIAVSTYGVVSPLADTPGGTVTEPGSAHTLSSEVPVAYASTLRDRGIPASPELLLLSVHDGQPYIARGVNFTAYAQLSTAKIVRGQEATDVNEAIVGTDLARTLDVSVGDTLTVGGSTASAVSRVHITGVYTAGEPHDDQLLMSLRMGQHLSGRQPGTAHMIRVGSIPKTSADVSILDLTVPDRVPANDTANVTVTLANPTPSNASRTVRVSFGEQTQTRAVTVAPGTQRRITMSFATGSVRTVWATVGNQTKQVEIVSPNALEISSAPAQAPPGSAPRLRIVTVTGKPVSGAVVTVGDETRHTDRNGWTRVSLPEAGTLQIHAEKEGHEATATVAVSANAQRELVGSLAITPQQPTVLTTPTAQTTLYNPWNQSVTREVSIAGANDTRTTTVQLAPGETTTLSTQLSRQPPGRYTVTVTARETLSTAKYRVGGDARLAASLAATGRNGPSGGLSQAAQTIFGNLELVVAVLLVLVGLMAVGATTSAFSGAVHSREQTLGIHRAVGASPWAILRLVLGDALRIGLVATALGLLLAGAGLWVLDTAGLLTVYGIRLLSTVSLTVTAVAVPSAVVLALVGATVATWLVIRTEPSRLLA